MENAALFWGIIESQNGNQWVVSGITVTVTAQTQIDQSNGAAVVGAYVKIKGAWNPDHSSVSAYEIEVLSPDDLHMSFTGIIEQKGAQAWVISGVQVHVDANTQVDEQQGAAVVGARVRVWAALQLDGSLYAQRIKVLHSEVPPTRTPEPPERIHFRGLITAQNGNVWTINGREVQITDTTVIDEQNGHAVVGALVDVEAHIQGTALVADQIEVIREQVTLPTAFRGTIERMTSAEWTVSGRVVHLSSSTVIVNQERAQIGALAMVYGQQLSDGSVQAERIAVMGTPQTRRYQTEFRGRIRSFSGSEWVVGAYRMAVTSSTVIVGTPQVGLIAEVHAEQQGSRLVATRIRVQTQAPSQFLDFEGLVQSIGTTSLVVSGRTVVVSAATFVDESHGMLQVDSRVEVRGMVQADGSVLARVIKVED
jgi:hypothetical protein